MLVDSSRKYEIVWIIQHMGHRVVLTKKAHRKSNQSKRRIS